jgi:hypothetical protein
VTLANPVSAEYAAPFKLKEKRMAKSDLASMSVEALMKMRDEVIQMLSRKSGEIQRQLPRWAMAVG